MIILNISAPPAEALSGRHRFLMMASICIGVYISHFTAGIVNVSLPKFMIIFQTELETVQWITTGYLLVIASLLPIMGKLGDRYGHRCIHNLGYVFFTISSVLVAFSPNISVLLILRMVQAIGAAMFQATNIALITIHVPKGKRGHALGIMSTAVALGAMTGPIIGGFIAEWLSWQWLFLMHVPVALVATLLAMRYIPERGQERQEEPFDSIGMILFIFVIGSVIFGISNGNAWGWLSAETLSLSVAAVIAFFLFLLRESREKSSFLPLGVFHIPEVSYGLIISCVSFMLANSVLVTIPFFLSRNAGFSSVTVGTIMIAYPILLAFTGPVAGHLSDRYGSRSFMFMGLCGMGIGLTALALYLHQLSTVGIVAVLALIGVGMGLIASPNNSFIMRYVPMKDVGSIGGMIALTRNAGMVLGAALGLGVMNGDAIQDSAPLLGALKSVFGLGGIICMASIIMLGYSVLLNKKKA
ncbi:MULTISPECIES: MFS transporter [Paenibacillus]